MDEQENVTENLSIDEATATVVADLPEAVQRFVTGPERDRVSLDLTRKYELHADQAGDFEHAYLFMLLGLHTPEEFGNELRKAGLPETTIQGLANDLNERVFKKLRDEERIEASIQQVQVAPQVPVMKVGGEEVHPPPNLPGQLAAQTPQPPIQQSQLVNTPPQAVTPSPSVLMQPAYAHPQIVYVAQPIYQTMPPTPIYSNPVSVPPMTNVNPPAARTMAHDMELVAQGYQGQFTQATHQNASVYTQQVPSGPPSQPQRAPEPTPSTYPPPTMAPVRLTPIDRVNTGIPITKEYGSDPYREPIQ